jgi:hypothetical protein
MLRGPANFAANGVKRVRRGLVGKLTAAMAWLWQLIEEHQRFRESLAGGMVRVLRVVVGVLDDMTRTADQLVIWAEAQLIDWRIWGRLE